jgi:hypothetical protein
LPLIISTRTKIKIKRRKLRTFLIIIPKQKIQYTWYTLVFLR